MRGAGWDAIRERAPVVEHVVTSDAESFLWRCDDYPWARNVWNIHPEYEIHLVRNASGIALVGDHIERFEPGHLTIVGSHLPHDWVTSLGPGERIPGRDIVLQFDAGRIRRAASVFPECGELDAFLRLALRGLAFHGETRRLGAAALEAMGEASGLERLSSFLRLLGMMAQRGEYRVLSSPGFAPARDAATQDTIGRVLAHVLKNFTGELRLADLAQQLAMSDSAFSRFFARNVGNSFTDYVTALRIGSACKLLADTDKPVTAVCYESGYTNVSNFNRIFRRLRGVTPSDYRRMSHQRSGHRPIPAPAPGGNDLMRRGDVGAANVASQQA